MPARRASGGSIPVDPSSGTAAGQMTHPFRQTKAVSTAVRSRGGPSEKFAGALAGIFRGAPNFAEVESMWKFPDTMHSRATTCVKLCVCARVCSPLCEADNDQVGHSLQVTVLEQVPWPLAPSEMNTGQIHQGPRISLQLL